MLLDSNILIYAANQSAPAIDLLVTAFGNSVASVTQIEVYGFIGLSPAEASALNVLFQRLTIKPLDATIVQRTIALRQENKMGLADAIIAATALVHSLPLVTRNVDDFKRVAGLKLINPFTAEV